MKILSIHFKNLNSVEGESRVDFRKPPFADAGVFAITGPNGSGKSTILDAITLGLYGETYRFDRPAMHVMTRRTADSFSEVEFAVAGENYKSIWSVKREKGDPNGALMNPEMTLSKVEPSGEEEVIANSQQTVCQQIIEITGMNFRNFTRSIMLAQGDFAAFLNALDSERLDILEKIINTDIYSEYKNEILTKSQESSDLLKSLDAEISSLNILDKVTLEAKEHDLIDFKEQLEEDKKLEESLRQQKSWLKNVKELSQQFDLLTEKESSIQLKVDENQKLLNKIDESQEVLQFSEDYSKLENFNQTLSETQSALAAYRDESRQLQEKLAASGILVDDNSTVPTTDSISDRQAALEAEKNKHTQYQVERQDETLLLNDIENQLNDKKALLQTVDEWLEENAKDHNLLTNFPDIGTLKKIRIQLEELTKEKKSATKWAHNTGKAIKKTSASANKINHKLIKLKLAVQRDEQKLEALALGRDYQEIQELLKDQHERLADFNQLFQLSRSLVKLTQTRSSLFGSATENDERSLTEMRSELNEYREDLKSQENIRKALEEAVANETLLNRMASERHYLEDGKPCPLCGSKEHPYAMRTPVVGDSRRALADQRAKVQATVAAIERVNSQIDSTEKKGQVKQAKNQKIAQLQSEWQSLSNRLNVAGTQITFNDIGKVKKLCKIEAKELKNIKKLSKDYLSLLTKIEKKKQLIEKRESVLDQQKVLADQLNEQWQERPKEIEEIDQKTSQLQQEEKALTESISKQLDLIGETVPGKGKEDGLADLINQRRQDYQSYALRSKNLKEEINESIERIKQGQDKLADLEQKLKASTDVLQQQEFASMHLALVEKQKLLSSSEEKLIQQQQEMDVMRNSLQQKISAVGIGDIDELKQTFELIEQKAELEQQNSEFAQQLTELKSQVNEVKQHLEMERQKALTDASEESIVIELRQVSEKIDIINHEIQQLEVLLGNQQQARQQLEILEQKRAAQQEIVSEQMADIKLMESDQGMVFRRKVQNKMADKLLSEANKVLEKISGRYYLRQIPSDKGLAIEIEDTFQKNARRKPKTLSGGESFVVSLALALALSNLAGNGKSVDSLFLDEGFGTLDADTLFVVISTLESLQTHGKKVGVISHVEAIQKRIKAQLQMGIKPNGMSFLKGSPEQEIIF